MEPVLGGGPEWIGSSGQGGHVMGQEKPASQGRGVLGIGEGENT
jgi:hypothetical protein